MRLFNGHAGRAPGNDRTMLLYGELTASGGVSINGARAISGETVFSKSTISTAEEANAIISLGKLGRTELSQNSSIQLDFTETSNSVLLNAGQVRVSAPADYSANILTMDTFGH